MTVVVPSARRARLALGLTAPTPTQWGLAIMAIVLTGVATAILTTSDPGWWHLHFSRLGMFADASGSVFNGTLALAGLTALAFARRVHLDIARLGRSVARRGTATTTRALLSILAVNLSLAGCVPLTLNETMHNVVAYGMVAAFAGLLSSAPWMLHGLPRRLRVATLVVVGYLAVAGTLFGLGVMNAAGFEAIAFTAMFGWTGVFTRCLAAAVRDEVSAAPRPSAARDATAARRHRPARSRRPAILRPARRRVRRPLAGPAGAAAAPGRPRPGCTASAARAASERWRTPDRR